MGIICIALPKLIDWRPWTWDTWGFRDTWLQHNSPEILPLSWTQENQLLTVTWIAYRGDLRHSCSFDSFGSFSLPHTHLQIIRKGALTPGDDTSLPWARGKKLSLWGVHVVGWARRSHDVARQRKVIFNVTKRTNLPHVLGATARKLLPPQMLR